MPKNQPVETEATLIGAFEAKTHLSKLLRQTRTGKHFIITQRGQPVAELRAIGATPATQRSRWGDMKGKIQVADHFCDEIEDMREYME